MCKLTYFSLQGGSNIEKEGSTSSRPENKAEEHMDWEISTPTIPLSRSRSDSSSDESFTSAIAQPGEQFDSQVTEKEEQVMLNFYSTVYYIT
jgi:hypothetical protein